MASTNPADFVFTQTIYVFILLLSLSHVPRSTSKAQTNLQRGAHLSVGDYLTFLDDTFTFGFYGGGNVFGDAYWLAIWFTAAASLDDQRGVVWMANRDNPVKGHGSRLTLERDGGLVLTDFDGSVAWLSKTTSMEVDKLELLNSGNLVMRQPDTNGAILWQSFDLPTDTLLPGQPLTKSTTLISGLGKGNFGSGYFNLFFDNDNVLRLLYNGPQITSLYWPWPDYGNPYFDGRTKYNSSRIALLDDQGNISSSDLFQASASDWGTPGVKRMLKMDYDGNLRLYSLKDSAGSSWDVSYVAVTSRCLIHGRCGPFGICGYRPGPGCYCPPGYEQANSTDWSQGCRPKFKASCKDSIFVEMKNTNYYSFSTYLSQVVNFEECKELCRGDCRCHGFSYRKTGEGFCSTKSTFFNGYNSPDFPASFYMRLPGRNQSAETRTLSGSFVAPREHAIWAYLYSFAASLGVIEILVIAIGWFLLFRKHGISASLEDGYRAVSSQFRRFNYRELKRATSQFKVIIGRGGFGIVYKDTLEDGRVVAVKRLGNVLGEDEFWVEVNTIGRINHMNLVRMCGFSSERQHRMLVYEYIENGSLDKHLFSPDRLLGWKDRFKVASGTAKGLAYLHHECLEWIIHCDVKPENILLDTGFDPKISDFGLAKLSQRGASVGSRVTRIRGTKGYMAPEWAMSLPITAKVDVYSYGVVILELVKGIRLSGLAVDSGNLVGEDQESELSRIERLVKERIRVDGKDTSWIEEIVDPRLEGRFSRKQAYSMLRIGVSCVDEDRSRRPTMESVAQLLLECEESVAGSSSAIP